MLLKYFKILSRKTKIYNNKAQNPFLNKDFKYNPFKSIYQQTYFWVEKPKDDFELY